MLHSLIDKENLNKIISLTGMLYSKIILTKTSITPFALFVILPLMLASICIKSFKSVVNMHDQTIYLLHSQTYVVKGFYISVKFL